MKFEITGDITDIEIIAKGKSIRELKRLNKVYGKGRWRKLKGIADIRIDKRKFRAVIHCTGMRLMALARRNSKLKKY